MHNVHIKDAIRAYRQIDRVSVPSYAKPFDIAVVNFTMSIINGKGKQRIIKLSEKEFESYIAILENQGC